MILHLTDVLACTNCQKKGRRSQRRQLLTKENRAADN
jgi:hypothetical protein